MKSKKVTVANGGWVAMETGRTQTSQGFDLVTVLTVLQQWEREREAEGKDG